MPSITPISVFLILLLGLLPARAQEVSKPAAGTYALTNATLVTITRGTIAGGTIVIADGKIAALGAEVDIPEGATVIDCTGHEIYPGFIDAGTQLGLIEIGSVSLTRDANEIGELIPHMQALTAVNPNAVAIPVTRVNGVTTVLTQPSGGLFPGAAALINLLGYTPEQMYAGFKGVVMNFPNDRRSGWRDRRSKEEREKDREKAVAKLDEVWEEATLYARLKAEPEAEPIYSPALEALAPVVTGEATLLLEVNAEKDIRNALAWIKDKALKVIFTGVAEGWRVAEELAGAGVPVITGPVLSYPTRDSDRYDRPYANPGLMQQAGVKVAIRSNDTENVRNLPFNAGFAATYGMGREEALRAITIVPAELFGVADRLGSLEVGKTANLFVATGDPFEMKTEIKYLFIDGWQVPIDSRHIRLYNEFLDRRPGLRK